MNFVCLKENFVEHLKFENNFSTLDNILDENSRSSHKCGEIFISEEEVFNFLCTLCESPFEEVDKFFVHVKSIHKNTNGQKNLVLDPLKQDANEYQCEKIKSESQSIAIIEQNSIDKLNSNSPENALNPCDEEILNEDLLSESRDEVNEESESISEHVSDDTHTDEDERWHEIKKKEQKVKTRKKFRSNNLNEYKQGYSAEENTDLLCGICNKGFKTIYTLRRHLKNIHSIRASKNNNSPVETEFRSQSNSVLIQLKSTVSKNIEEKNNSYFEKTLHKCKYCDRQFKEQSKLEEHETIYCGDKPSECQTCGKQFTTKVRLWRHETIHTNIRQHKCDFCQSAFKTKSGLHSHMLIHGEKKYSCNYCAMRFFRESEKKVHERLHTGEKPFVCIACGKQFTTKARLGKHEAIHSDIREHKCDICESAFKDKSGLYSHMLRHGEKKYSCNHCAKKFVLQSEKKEHERFHSDERPYVCNCGKCFKTQNNLNIHLKSHTGSRPHKCQYCDKGFLTKAYLKNHIVMHTGERPFMCSICEATFPRLKALRSHEKIHSDVKGYVCKICGAAFKQNAGLYCHKKSHEPFRKLNSVAMGSFSIIPENKMSPILACN